MKNAKRIVSLVLVIAFTLSLGYFATLTPTGAWLYDATEESVKYEFGTFDVTTGQFTISEDITFDATTKFNDYVAKKTKVSDDAAVDFDNAQEFENATKDKIVYKKDITVINSGNVPARIYLSLDGGKLNPDTSDETTTARDDLGISYFFYEVPSEETSIRETMETKLVAFSGDDTPVTNDNRMTVLENYQDSYITIPAPTGEETQTSMTLRVLFWADHDIVGSALDDTDNVKTLNTDARIILTAIQDTDGAIDSYYNSVTA